VLVGWEIGRGLLSALVAVVDAMRDVVLVGKWRDVAARKKAESHRTPHPNPKHFFRALPHDKAGYRLTNRSCLSVRTCLLPDEHRSKPPLKVGLLLLLVYLGREWWATRTR
jgi:hypothetical protein